MFWTRDFRPGGESGCCLCVCRRRAETGPRFGGARGGSGNSAAAARSGRARRPVLPQGTGVREPGQQAAGGRVAQDGARDRRALRGSPAVLDEVREQHVDSLGRCFFLSNRRLSVVARGMVRVLENIGLVDAGRYVRF